MLRWDPRAMDVFRKKYGEIKFAAALQSLRLAAETFLRERQEPGTIGVHAHMGLSAILSGDPPRAVALGQELAKRLNTVALTLYEGDDRVQGHIKFRDPRTGREEHLPLLTFSARIDPDTPV
jgi:hypothetical protein